jgi:GNAT superfamily N-acetyltransferase
MLTERAALSADYGTFVRFYRELGVTDDPIPSAETWAGELAKNCLMLEEDGKIVGYGNASASRDTAWVFHVVVDPSARGRRIGHRVMDALARRLRAAGCTRWTLNVKPDNAPAMALYARWGFSVVHRSAAMRVTWERTESLARGPFAARPLAADGREDGAVEAACGLFPGQLGIQRLRGARFHIFVADGAASTAGVAAFDPTVPGAAPFRVAPAYAAERVAVARALFDAMREVARPEFDHTRLVAEGDLALRDALSAVGAETLLVFDHMRGDIPPA